MNSNEVKYTREHEWIKVEGKLARIGITDYAQKSLGDVVFVELPDLDRELKAGEVMGVVESVKAVSDIYAPCTGRVITVNEALLDSPELINQDPFGDGWMVEVELDGLDEELLSAQEYEELVKEEAE